MFTGIITDIGEVIKSVKTKSGMTITIKTPTGWEPLELGESIAHDGACLTVSKLNKGSYEVFLMPETLRLTSFGVEVPKKINLERSLKAGDRFGGHFVQGHVDGVGVVSDVKTGDDYRLTVKFGPEHSRLVALKGAISISGVSLTVAECRGNQLTVALIPHTLENTNLSSLKTGDSVNLEFDMLAKHVIHVLDLNGKT